MLSKNICFAISSYKQACEVVISCQKNKIIPIIYIRYFLANGLGPDWIKELIYLLNENFSNKNYEIFIDCKKNYGLFINLVEQKINYLMVDAKFTTLLRLKQIAKKNNVLINPKLSVVDIAKIKNIDSKINKLKQNDY